MTRTLAVGLLSLLVLGCERHETFCEERAVWCRPIESEDGTPGAVFFPTRVLFRGASLVVAMGYADRPFTLGGESFDGIALLELSIEDGTTQMVVPLADELSDSAVTVDDEATYVVHRERPASDDRYGLAIVRYGGETTEIFTEESPSGLADGYTGLTCARTAGRSAIGYSDIDRNADAVARFRVIGDDGAESWRRDDIRVNDVAGLSGGDLLVRGFFPEQDGSYLASVGVLSGDTGAFVWQAPESALHMSVQGEAIALLSERLDLVVLDAASGAERLNISLAAELGSSSVKQGVAVLPRGDVLVYSLDDGADVARVARVATQDARVMAAADASPDCVLVGATEDGYVCAGEAIARYEMR